MAADGSTTDGVHWPRRGDELRAVDLVPDPLVAHVSADYIGDGVVRRAVSQQGFHIRFLEGEQAVAQLAVRGQPQPVAIQAERTADGSDESDSPDSIGETIFGGRRASVAVGDFLQRADLAR